MRLQYRDLEPIAVLSYRRIPFTLSPRHDGSREIGTAQSSDWLAFAHLAIAVFFIGPVIDPARNIWVIWAGLIACAGIVPLALIGGSVRGIPMGWRMIDCSFGVLGALPLAYCLRSAKRLEVTRADDR